MPFTKSEIQRIESEYEISLPQSYKKLLIAVGDELLNKKPSFLAPDLSIYDLQQSARRMKEYLIEEGQILSDLLTDAFFIMRISSTVLDRYYFIHPHGQTDCSVYCWKIYEDSNSIEKVSSNIGEWLCQVDLFLYIKAKMKIIFHLNNQ